MIKKPEPQRFTKTNLELIEEVVITPYEKIWKILHKIEKYIISNKELTKDIQWAIKVISSQKLYLYEGCINENYEKNSSFEVKSWINYLNVYSGNHNYTFKERNKRSQTVMTTKPELKIDTQFGKFGSNNSLTFKDDTLALNSQGSKNKDSDLILDDPSDDYSPIYSLENNNEYSMFNIDFNIFEFYKTWGEQTAFQQGCDIILSKYDIAKYSDKTTLNSFIKTIQDNYSKNAFYHTEKHGLDVWQTISIIITKSSLIEIINLNYLDIASILIAAMCHDVGHPGYTNDFHVKTQTDLAINYNDKNVWENFHTAMTFQILKNNKNNIFINWSHEDFVYVRKRMIEMIWSTDMWYHSKMQAWIKNRIERNQIVNGENAEKIIDKDKNNLFGEQQDIMNYWLHAADISHSAKDFSISLEWTNLLVKEFWRQGDEEKEKGFTINVLFDRNYTDIPRSQIGFIKGIIVPCFDTLVQFLPELSYYSNNVYQNWEKWNEQVWKNGNKDTN